jgi:hypothetical protein
LQLPVRQAFQLAAGLLYATHGGNLERLPYTELQSDLNMTPNQLQNLFKQLPGQDAEEIKANGLSVLRQLREALGYSEIANLTLSGGN